MERGQHSTPGPWIWWHPTHTIYQVPMFFWMFFFWSHIVQVRHFRLTSLSNYRTKLCLKTSCAKVFAERDIFSKEITESSLRWGSIWILFNSNIIPWVKSFACTLQCMACRSLPPIHSPNCFQSTVFCRIQPLCFF